MVGIKLRPHELRGHAATYACRSGVPIEIVSKVVQGMLICLQLYRSTASNLNTITFHIIHLFHPYRNIEFEVDSIRRLI